MFRTLALTIAAAVGLTTTLFADDSSPAPSTVEVAPVPDGHFSKETPYGSPTTSTMTPPRGYSMIFIESIGRHGSRTSTSTSAEDKVLKLWKGAQGELTDVGKALPADVMSFQTAEKKVGYGNLSTRGKAEWAGIGARTATSYEPFFIKMQERKWSVSSVTTTVHRTKQSLAAFEGGLMTNTDVKIGKATADKSLIDFDSARSKQGTRDLDTIKSRPDVVEASTNILERIYSASYVRSLKHPVDEALDIYQLYCIAAGMDEDTDVDFAPYVHPEDAEVMAYARDAAAFYKYGPGVKGENGTYKGAKALRTEFFKALDARIDGGKRATVFRLAHGETTMPFAALLQLPGSELHATKGTPYTYANNPWRGDKIGGMAGNIEWVAYRNSKKVLVTMRYNEEPALFRSACKPVSDGSFFYKPSELKRCLPKS